MKTRIKETIVHLPMDVPLLPARELAWGRLRCLYENGNLRYIKYGEIELVRMLYSAVRDAAWNTAIYEIRDEKVSESPNGFHIQYTAFYSLEAIKYKAHIIIEASGNAVSMHMKGEALTHFLKARIGLCVHHPLQECIGQPVIVENPDGAQQQLFFPTTISPHQPFLNVGALHWKAAGTVPCSLYFEGDVFETEDQRNWTDASFKTYSTPLSLPYPVAVAAGEKIEQRIVLKISDANLPSYNPLAQPVQKFPFPSIGYQRRTEANCFSDEDRPLLKPLPVQHYRAAVYFRDKYWASTLMQAVSEAAFLKTGLELYLLFDNAVTPDLEALIQHLDPYSHLIKSMVPQRVQSKATDDDLFKEVYAPIKALDPHIEVGWGTDYFFAELNRNQPTVEADFIAFSATPQVHLSDNRSLIENLEALPYLLPTARTFFPFAGVHVSPLTLRIRNAYAESEADHLGFDERLYTSFGAWWLLAATACLAETGWVTLPALTSLYGLLAHAPEAPLYKALVQIKEFNPSWISYNAAQKAVILEHADGEKLLYVLQMG